jgi:hypothetical protein
MQTRSGVSVEAPESVTKRWAQTPSSAWSSSRPLQTVRICGRDAADPADPVGGVLAKIVRVLPERVAGSVRTVREISAPPPFRVLESPPLRRALAAPGQRLAQAAGDPGSAERLGEELGRGDQLGLAGHGEAEQERRG